MRLIASRLAEEVAAQHLTADASQQAAAAHLDRLAEALRTPPRSWLKLLRNQLPWMSASDQLPLRGVYLWGGVGRGKTLLMDLFFDSLESVRCERTHFYRFMREVHAQLRSIKHLSDPLDTVAERIAARLRVICLDEFFVSDIADAMILSGLFEGLFNRGVTLVTTSNVAPQNLYKDGLQRQRFLPAIELIERNVEIVNLDGGIDYRLRQLEQAPTYLDSNLPDTAAQMKARFALMAGAVIGGAVVLNIEDRPIKALATGPGMVWFDFKAICEGPRSQNDYIEVARLYHTVFISDVPLFTRINENSARRFIMLIDEFYDRRVNIVVSATAPPPALYQGEKLQFEFERAASRLIEMQAEEYLSGEHRP